MLEKLQAEVLCPILNLPSQKEIWEAGKGLQMAWSFADDVWESGDGARFA